MAEVRPIDANSFIGFLHNQEFIDGDDRSRVYRWIEEQPTIEPEVRHGRWIEETEPDENGNVIALCNQCYHTDEHGVNMKIPYCWYCGARMTKVNDNE